jgi:hypothetical protein
VAAPTLEAVRKAYGFHKRAAEVPSAEATRYRPADEWDKSKDKDLEDAAKTARAKVLASRRSRSARRS